MVRLDKDHTWGIFEIALKYTLRHKHSDIPTITYDTKKGLPP